MATVEVKKGEPVDKALKKLKNIMETESILEEYRRRRNFENGSQRKQRKARNANKKRLRYRLVVEQRQREIREMREESTDNKERAE